MRTCLMKWVASLSAVIVLLSRYSLIKQVLGTGHNTSVIVLLVLTGYLIWIWRQK